MMAVSHALHRFTTPVLRGCRRSRDRELDHSRPASATIASARRSPRMGCGLPPASRSASALRICCVPAVQSVNHFEPPPLKAELNHGFPNFLRRHESRVWSENTDTGTLSGTEDAREGGWLASGAQSLAQRCEHSGLSGVDSPMRTSVRSTVAQSAVDDGPSDGRKGGSL
jgi:hypothetical protein